MRGDVATILEMKAFIARLLDPADLGRYVTQEVVDAARAALDNGG